MQVSPTPFLHLLVFLSLPLSLLLPPFQVEHVAAIIKLPLVSLPSMVSFQNCLGMGPTGWHELWQSILYM